MNSFVYKTNLKQVFETFFYYIVTAISILLFFFATNLGLQSFKTSRDLEVFCQAGTVIANGGNPYLTSELGLELSWNYPPALAYGFYYVCPLFNLKQNYIWIYIIVFFLSTILWFTRKNWLYGIILCSTGLFSLGWVIITGNISTIELLLFSISIFLFFRKKINASVFIFGLFASLKLIPILYIPAFLFSSLQEAQWLSRKQSASEPILTKQSPTKLRFFEQVKDFFTVLWLVLTNREKITTILWALAGYISLPLLSVIIAPHLFPWYLRQMLGFIPNQHNPLTEFNPLVLNQSLSVMILSFLGLESQLVELNLMFSFVIYMLGIGFLFLLLKILSTKNELIIFCLSIILLTIFIPRLKPYSFLPTILCFYLISKEHSNLLKSMYLVLLSIIPTILHLVYFYTNNNYTIIIFHQIIFLCVTTTLLIFSTFRRYKSLEVIT